MALHLVCQCGNDLTVPELKSGAAFRCPRCGRLLHADIEKPDPHSAEETFIYNADQGNNGAGDTPPMGSRTPHRISTEDAPEEEATRINTAEKTAPPRSAPSKDGGDATRVFDPTDGFDKDEHDFDVIAPEEEETQIASAYDLKNSDNSGHSSGGSRRGFPRSSEINLSERVMGTINRPTIPLKNADSSGTYGIHQILRTHQKGGMGRILIAYDQHLKRDVALKELHPEVAEDDSIVRRFIGEAEITAQLEHPGIVPIHSLDLDRGGNPYYTMKLIKGHTFQEAIKTYHRNPSRQELMNLVRRLVSICKTMAFAHNKGVIHRDLKPANIMLGEHGETLVMDWGLAKPFNQVGDEGTYASVAIEHRSEPRPDLTMVGAIVGTPAFMSPEQAMPEDYVVGPLSDIFSLGTILYYLLAGQTAFSGRSTQEVLKKVRAATPPRPSEIKPNVPPGLEAICAKAMAKDAENRYQNATEMVDDLCRWLDGEPVLAQKETLYQSFRRWIEHHRFLSISVPLVLILIIVLTNVGIHLDRSQREKDAQALIQSILDDPIDLTDQPLVTIGASPGLTVKREPRQTGGTMVCCTVEVVPKSGHGYVEFAAPAGNSWNLSRRGLLSFSLFESHADKHAALTTFFIRMGHGSSYFEYRPTEEFWNRRKRSNWFPFTVPLSGASAQWTRTETELSSASAERIEWIEFHFDVNEPMTLHFDHVSFQKGEL